MEDKFALLKSDLESIPRHGYDVTLSDTEDLPIATRGIILATAGAVKVTWVGGEVQTIPLLAAGVTHAGAFSRIWQTGTTATGIAAVY